MALVTSGYAFCPRCGAAQGETEPPVAVGEIACPGCGEPMSAWAFDPGLGDGSGAGYRGSEGRIHACRGCGGAWVDRRTLDEMIARATAQAQDIDPNAVQRRTMAMSPVIIYRSCPSCGQQMNRRNFARYSGIVVDECRTCGSFFDAGELEGVFAFIRSGGLALSERRCAEEVRRDRAQRHPLQRMPTPHADNPQQAELDVLVWFLRWVGRWLRRMAR
jgi:Zn-finger nucleic acid-binding protein